MNFTESIKYFDQQSMRKITCNKTEEEVVLVTDLIVGNTLYSGLPLTNKYGSLLSYTKKIGRDRVLRFFSFVRIS
jgi:hypothetical protein